MVFVEERRDREGGEDREAAERILAIGEASG